MANVSVTPAPEASIDVDALVLEYPIYKHIVADRARYLLGMIHPSLRPPMRRILDGVTLRVAPGEVVGLLGRNGAGKTSLLKIISGLVPPTSGRVRTRGKIMALLAMGAGFRPTFTGHENLRYVGLLLGMSSAEMARRIDVIAAFSELGEALDQPYFTYSSGMKARLAFSLATHVTADIVILDETLAAGDQRFVSKCHRQLQAIRNSGATILLVSHNLGEIARLSSRVIVLEGGVVRFDGGVFPGLELYERVLLEQLIASGEAMPGIEGTRIRLDVQAPDGASLDAVRMGQPVELVLDIDCDRAMGSSFVFLRMFHVETNALCCYVMVARWSGIVEGKLGPDNNVDLPPGRTTLRWSVPHWVPGEGTYSVDVYVGPATTPEAPDQSRGRFWRGARRITVIYGSHFLKGANSTLELPVSRLRVERAEAS